MKADVLILIDTYATSMQWAVWAGSAVFFAAHLALAWLFLATSRNAWHRIAASFAAAHQTIADIQQPRKEKP